MKISIVTISFNQKKYLKQCIDSVLEQTDCEVEYIIVDPGSTDGSRELIESYGDRIIKVFERDDGPADGLNKGFARATGQIYGFINSDDYLLPDALKHVRDFFAEHDENCFITGYGFTENEFGKRISVNPTRLTVKSMLHRSAVMFQQTTFFPAFLYKKIDGFNKHNETCWDYELFLNFLLRDAKHYVVERNLAVFRLYEDSISGSGRLEEKYFQELDQLFIKHFGRKRGLLDKLLTFYFRIKRDFSRKIFKKISNRGKLTKHKILANCSRLVNRFITLVVDKHWLIDYLPKSKTGRNELLLVRLDLIGDFIIWLDAAKEFKHLYPVKRIVLYANAVWAPLAEQLAYWEEVISVDVNRLRFDNIYRFKLLCEVHSRGFDIAIQPTYSREYVSDLIIRASNARQRIGHQGDTNNISPENKVITDTWYTDLAPQAIFPEVELNINAELIRFLGNKEYKSRTPQLDIQIELPSEFKIDSEYCVFVPGASWGPKMWPVINFAELASKISKSSDLKIILCGSQSERNICNQVADLSGVATINLSGQTTLVQMIEIIRRASLVVANDSASLHIAAATRTHSVCVLGGGHFGRFLPYQSEFKESDHFLPVVVFHPMDCYGCRWRCKYPLSPYEAVPCISSINVDRVMKVCDSIIKLNFASRVIN